MTRLRSRGDQLSPPARFPGGVMESLMGQFKFSLFSAVPENGVYVSRETSDEGEIPLPPRNGNNSLCLGPLWHPRPLCMGLTPSFPALPPPCWLPCTGVETLGSPLFLLGVQPTFGVPLPWGLPAHPRACSFFLRDAQHDGRKAGRGQELVPTVAPRGATASRDAGEGADGAVGWGSPP